jgi:predicted nucleotide-binding protein
MTTERREPESIPPRSEAVLHVTRSQLDEEIGDRLEQGRELIERDVTRDADFEAWDSDWNTWDAYNFRLLKSRFSTTSVADEYRRWIYEGSASSSLGEEDFYRERIREQMQKLVSIRQQLKLYRSEADPREITGSSAGLPRETKVFMVHGHDNATKLEVAQFIERITGDRPIILHEQVDQGLRTIIEKFEDYASEIGFAVVLLTADDLGRAKEEMTLSFRSRQNVVLELGFFIGRLGRNRVVALYGEGVELPSDLHGMLRKSLSGNWYMELARELQAAGIEVDLNAALNVAAKRR